MENFVWGNMAWNAGLVGMIAFFGKRWMDTTEGKIKEGHEENIKVSVEIKSSIDNLTAQMKVANGRTTKNEMGIALLAQHCSDKEKDRELRGVSNGN